MAGELIRSARNGNRFAMGNLLRGHVDAVRLMATRELGDSALKSDVERLVAHTLGEAEEDFSSFIGTTEEEWLAWLRTLLKRRLGEESPSQSDHIRVAIATLPTVQSQVVRLHQMHGWNVTRIADHLGLDEVTIAGLLRQGLRRLRQAIEPENCDGNE